MNIGTILVNLDVDGDSSARLKYAVDLAGDLDAHLIGFAACSVRPIVTPDGGFGASANYYARQTEQNHSRIKELEEEFYSIAGQGANSSWRQSDFLPTDALVRNTRAADLIIAGTPHGAAPYDIHRMAIPSDLVCGAGRPILFVAENGEYEHPDRALIGWKDTVEARRALCCALPFLLMANHVLVATVIENGNSGATESVGDVMRFLMRHGIRAHSQVLTEDDAAAGFVSMAKREHVNIVMTGAYGHSRAREWIFGGFTRELLDETGLNRLMAS